MRISGKKSVIRKSTNTKHPILQAGILNVLHLPTGKKKKRATEIVICKGYGQRCLIKKKHLQYKQAEKGCVSASETRLRNQPG
ncbi:hypothetical protein L1987_81294 [Smallanthus sonchifolius]|uniref:Uncharacterized protein n=1 Tax=Smallanthus sonchifolius TaxID=185202 RepID=A0ACB8YRN9_9ASTR|nr:hypothetical protein L1987_81294 [Smallanthus sonchifolius]